MTYLDQYQEVTETLGYFWNSLFLQPEFVTGMTTSIALNTKMLNDLAARIPNYLGRHTIPAAEQWDYRMFVMDENTLDRQAFHYGDEGLTYNSGATYGQLLTDLPDYRYDFPEGFSPAYLAVGITQPGAILTLGVDYEVEGSTIIFHEDPLDTPNIQKHASGVLKDGTTIFRFILFGFQVSQDIQAFCDFFATMAGVCGPTSPIMERAMNTAWDLRVDGATSRNINRTLALLTATDYVDQTGKIEAIYLEGDRICVLTDNAVYTAPAEAQVLYEVGDTIREGYFVFDTYLVKDGADYIDFPDFEGLTLGPGFVPGLHGLFFENSIVDVVKTQHPSGFSIVPV